MTADAVQVAIFARAPQAGEAKTRLIPALGPQGAARLQRQLTRRAVEMALDSGAGEVTLWCAPHAGHRFFRAVRQCLRVECRDQPDADLGRRMLHAFEAHCARGPLVLIGTDCPALEPHDLRNAAQALRDGHDAVVVPAEDGGYVLIGLRRPLPFLFEGIAWGTDSVMRATRDRLRAHQARWCEPKVLWDVDRPEDLERLRALRPDLLAAPR
ncbi:MAG: TIGR04282 family arsenosugar biosynthesis glycosyltransferase [Burkholderiales bacterium]